MGKKVWHDGLVYGVQGEMVPIKPSPYRDDVPAGTVRMVKGKLHKKRDWSQYKTMLENGYMTKYDPDFHPSDCERMGREGMFKVEMAKEWGVSCECIDYWVNHFDEMSISYKLSCNYRTAWLVRKGRDHLVGSKENQLNATAWSMMMRYDGQNTDARRVRIAGFAEARSIVEKADCVLRALGRGDLTDKEAANVMESLSKACKVDEYEGLRAKLEALEEKVG